jgi:hypothetical protein
MKIVNAKDQFVRWVPIFDFENADEETWWIKLSKKLNKDDLYYELFKSR